MNSAIQNQLRLLCSELRRAQAETAALSGSIKNTSGVGESRYRDEMRQIAGRLEQAKTNLQV